MLNPYHTVDDAVLWPLPPCDRIGGMKVRDAVSGSWQIGIGAPLHWFGLSKEDQEPAALGPHSRDPPVRSFSADIGVLWGLA